MTLFFPISREAADEPPRILPSALQAMIRHASEESPLESCGMLTGCEGLIERAVPLPNRSQSRVEFSVGPEDLFRFFRSLRSRSKEWFGIYHSHPQSAAAPSRRDVEEFHYPGVFYWIVSLQERPPDIRCFRWDRMGFIETKYHVCND